MIRALKNHQLSQIHPIASVVVIISEGGMASVFLSPNGEVTPLFLSVPVKEVWPLCLLVSVKEVWPLSVSIKEV